MLFLYLTAHNSDDLCKSNTGLGNVLFQLAFQYCVSKKYNIKPNYFHLSQFIKKLGNLGLTNYDTTIYRNFHNIDKGIIASSIGLIFSEQKKAHIYDQQLISNIIKHGNKNMLIKNSYLQSHKYFHEYEDIIQDLFMPDEISLKQIYLKYHQLKETDTINVSIHIRLRWGAIRYTSNYYKDAIDFLREKYKNTNSKINFFVFSDNIHESKKILLNLNYNFIYCEDNLDYIDLWIMSLCSDNIICHSTLGWWGAYLNKDKNKSILYPSDIFITFFKKILGRTNLQEIKDNFYPKEWICVRSNSIKIYRYKELNIHNLMNVIKTNDIYTKENWNDVVERCGGWNSVNGAVNANIHLQNCSFNREKKTYYSQNGEEGIIIAILQKIGIKNKYCVELGANDGKSISNTYLLRKKFGFTRLLIEGDKNIKISPHCSDEKLVYELISSKNINILLKDIPNNVDFLSLDIDGDDYWVLKAMEKRPRLIILEYASGLPNELPLVCKEGKGTVESHEGSAWNLRYTPKEKHNPALRTLNGYYGANMLAFYRLMKKKGYEFVTSLSDNAFFVLKEEFKKLGIKEITEVEMINNYFNPAKYWGETHRDIYNNEWLIMN